MWYNIRMKLPPISKVFLQYSNFMIIQYLLEPFSSRKAMVRAEEEVAHIECSTCHTLFHFILVFPLQGVIMTTISEMREQLETL